MNGSLSLRRVLLICNPVAGGGRGRTLGPALAAALQQRGIDATCHLTRGAGDGRDRAQAAGAETWDALVAVGGDGTVNEVVNGMPDASRPLGVFPLGTANVLALELGLPRRIEAAAAAIAAGHVRDFALGRCGDRRFLLFAGFGLDGAVALRMHEAASRVRGKLKWLRPILHTLWHWPQFALRATLAGGDVLDGCHALLVTRVRNYGGVVTLPPEVSCDNRSLHVVAFRQRTRRAWLWLGMRGFVGRMRQGPQLVVRTTTAVHVDGEAPYQLDGDLGGFAPAKLTLEPAPARILVPR